MSANASRKKQYGIYMENILTRKVVVPFKLIGKNIEDILKQLISRNLEGRCASEGYIKKGSVNILSYSAGVASGPNIDFEVVCKNTQAKRFFYTSI